MPDQPDTRPHHRFDTQQFAFDLWRLSDEEYRQLRSRSFPIRYNGFFLLRLALDQRHSPDELTLSQSLAHSRRRIWSQFNVSRFLEANILFSFAVGDRETDRSVSSFAEN